MGAGRCAAVGVVTKSVDVEAALGVGVVAGEVPGNGGGVGLGGLLEGDSAGDLGVTAEECDYIIVNVSSLIQGGCAEQGAENETAAAGRGATWHRNRGDAARQCRWLATVRQGSRMGRQVAITVSNCAQTCAR